MPLPCINSTQDILPVLGGGARAVMDSEISPNGGVICMTRVDMHNMTPRQLEIRMQYHNDVITITIEEADPKCNVVASGGKFVWYK